MKYYAVTVNPLNVTRSYDELTNAYEKWLQKSKCKDVYHTYELKGKKLHIHSMVKAHRKPFMKYCRIPGYQTYLVESSNHEGWYRYMNKNKIEEEEQIFQHYCQNNYLF